MFMRWPSFRPVQSLCSPCGASWAVERRLCCAARATKIIKSQKPPTLAAKKIPYWCIFSLSRPPPAQNLSTAFSRAIIYIGIAFSPVIKCKFAILNKYFANPINLLTLYSIAIYAPEIALVNPKNKKKCGRCSFFCLQILFFQKNNFTFV